MPLVAVPDACVIFPASIRDTIFRAAAAQLFIMRITYDILDEVERNLHSYVVMKGKTDQEAKEGVQRLLEKIRENFDDSIINNHRELIDKMPINAKDRHVMAAAVASSAEVIVTQNLRDFPKDLLEPYGIIAQSPDDFLVDLFHNNPDAMTNVVVKQSWSLHNPPKSVPEVLNTLRIHVPVFANLIRKGMDLVDDPWPAHSEVNSDTL